MGNTGLSCCRGRGMVRLVLANGDVVEFREPVWASTVMKKYPQHIVLHCCMSNSRGMGQRRKVSMVRPEQHLKRKENYLITPFQATGNSKDFLDSWAFFALSACNKKLNAKIRQKSAKNRRWWIQTVFDKIFRSSRSSLPTSVDDSSKHLLGFNREDDSTRPLLGFNRPVPRPVVEPRKSCDGLPDWSPSLECIPESPTNTTHSSARLSRSSSSAPLSGSSSYASYPRLDFR